MRTNISLIVLFLGGLLALFFIDYNKKRPEKIHRQVSENLQVLIGRQEADIRDFENQLSVYTNPFSIKVNDEFPKRVYLNGGLIYWSDNQPLPEYSTLKQADTLYSFTDESGIKIIRRKEVIADRDLIEIFSIIPIMTIPPVTNQYLAKSYNPQVFGQYELIPNKAGTYHFTYQGINLFNAFIPQQKSIVREAVSMLLVTMVGVLLLTWITGLLKTRLGRGWKLGVVLGSLVLLLRFALYLWSIHAITSWELFDPIYFTAGIWAPSLGDLVLNGATLLCIAIIFYLVSGKFSWKVLPWGGTVLIAIGLISLDFLLVHLLYWSIWSLLEHSQIELDISASLTFGLLRSAAYFFLMEVGLAFLAFFSASIRILDRIGIEWKLKLLLIVFIYLVAGLLLQGFAFFYLGTFLVVWLLIDATGFNRAISSVRYQTFIFLVLVFSTVALVYAMGIFQHHEKDTMVAKERFASRLLIKNDILGEFYLSEIMQDISEDRYVRTRLMSKLLARQNIREKIRRQFLSPYFKKYDLDVFLFDSSGRSLQMDISTDTYEDWRAEFARDIFTTDYENIYFIEDKDENVRNKYVCFMPIVAYGSQVGYIVLSLTLKKYIPSSVFPELLLESKYYMGSNEEFDYGVFKNGELLYKQGRYSFENKLSAIDFKNEHLYSGGMEKDGFHYFGLQTLDDRILIIVSSTYESEALLANFSFIFLLLLFACGLIFVSGRIFNREKQFNLSTRIQLYLGLSFLLPMVIVSAALLNTLNTSYREEIDRSLQKRSYNISENLVDQSELFFTGKINIDDYAMEIAKAAAVSQSDLNVYDVKGRLVTSSQPEMFRLGLQSRLLDTKAYYKVAFKREQSIIRDQTIGKLDFKTSYTALRSYHDGRLLAILTMPYFDSRNHLRTQQVDVFGDLVVIFTLIFLISLIAGNVIVGQLVRPLKVIGEKIRHTSLQEKNQPIRYESEDEIGSLVKEYNLMLVKLEESKAALAASQKESAWKEIARQVAHEIKNPLTPMRLKIQQMMRSFSQESKEYKTFETLIAQVDSLSSIADSFSEFAKMPAPQNESIDLVSLIDNTIHLYQDSDVRLSKVFEIRTARVYMDPKIFSRIVTNILLNAIQSVEDKLPEIEVKLRKAGNKVILSVADNGSGITADQREKIFTPYFSTKSKGSGIGLAVAKKGIENAGGNIWFESEEGKGSTFFISLPLLQD